MKNQLFRSLLIPAALFMLLFGGIVSADDEALFILTFAERPDADMLAELSERGVELVMPLGADRYYARLSDSGGLSVLPAAVRLRRPQAEDKYDLTMRTLLSRGDLTDSMRLQVVFAPGTSLQQARALVETRGGSIEAEAYRYGNTLDVRLPGAALRSFAARDEVLIVAPKLTKKMHNAVSAERSNIDLARDEFGLSGAGIIVAIVDGGAVADHDDFGDRMNVRTEEGVSSHSTHVAGTVMGSGAGNESARGMAPGANGLSYDFGSSLSHWQNAVDEFGAQITNNSWGFFIGWDFNGQQNRWEFWNDQRFFGLYVSQPRNYDQFVAETGMTVVFSAGNDRNDLGPTSGKWYDRNNSGGFDEKDVDENTPGPDGPFYSIDTNAAGKNVITVGATTGSDAMTSFSSWGPTSDGRIKPEVVAKGFQTLSPNSASGYGLSNGTSMAAPVVSGGIALLMEKNRMVNGRDLRPDEVKALLAISAMDLGRAGPDYEFGFGLLDIQAAAEILDRDADENLVASDTARKRNKAKRDKPKYFRFEVPAAATKLKVALAWVDPPGPVVQFFSEGINPTLMNDLDLNVYWTKEKKRRTRIKEYDPYILDPANPMDTAKTGTNILDNIELVEIDNPKKGVWYVEVANGDFRDGRRQEFVIIVWTDANLDAAVESVKQPAFFE